VPSVRLDTTGWPVVAGAGTRMAHRLCTCRPVSCSCSLLTQLLHRLHRPKAPAVLWPGRRTDDGAAVDREPALLWTESRRALEVSIHKEKTRDHETWEADLLSHVRTPL